MRAHTDEQIIAKASSEEKNLKDITDNRVDITVDLEDENGTTHTYVVNFCRDAGGGWQAVEVSELSSL
ncbi:MAG TPA: hypothetical protein VGB63_03760 [Pedobacter sp.]|jgi:hypothetical protein